jgi:hypothetical protein
MRHAEQGSRRPAVLGRLKSAALIWALGAGLGLAAAGAQPGEQPPNRFYGALTVNGEQAPAGTVVLAFVGETLCGSRATTERGRYRVDVLSSRERPGCGLPGAVVSFRAGDLTAGETGVWAAGQFTRLDLTAPAGSTAGFDMARVNLDDPPCIPPAGDQACSEERRRLWAADRAAWTAVFASRGRPAPTPEEVFDEAFRMRIDANDPAAMGALARVFGWPHLRITALRFRGDEWIEITNLGGGPQLMDGWVIRSQGSGAEFAFPPGFTFAPGMSCKIYSLTPGPDSCVPAAFGRPNVWGDTADTALLIYAPLDLLADRSRYHASPASQPPPPNLRGVAS